MLSVKGISTNVGNKLIINNLSLTFGMAKMTGIIGPNGSGKTTLLRILAGTKVPTEGSVYLGDKDLQQYPLKERAKKIAVLPQLLPTFFSYTVYETVMLGRSPYQSGLLPKERQSDTAIVRETLERIGIWHLKDRGIDSLSGGERQKVLLAQVLVQQPKVLLLDEPTNHLDVSFQRHLFDFLKEWVEEEKATVVSVFHDLNLAGLYCDELLLLDNGEKIQCDSAEKVLYSNLLSKTFQTSFIPVKHPVTQAPQVYFTPKLYSKE